jgi:hypothetical protein
MTFKYFLVAVLIGFIFYLLLLPARLDAVRKAVIAVVVLTMLVFAIQPDWSTRRRSPGRASRAASICSSTCRTCAVFRGLPLLPEVQEDGSALRSWCASWRSSGRAWNP